MLMVGEGWTATPAFHICFSQSLVWPPVHVATGLSATQAKAYRLASRRASALVCTIEEIKIIAEFSVVFLAGVCYFGAPAYVRRAGAWKEVAHPKCHAVMEAV
jgi:hypothetical protein